MSASLSALLPFSNSQHLALSLLPSYIDSLSDLTSDWEMVLVDDGSRDATAEILCDFAQAYPQVRLALHARPRGVYLAYCTALALSRGQILFLPLSHKRVNLDGLHRLWATSHHVPVVVGVAGDAHEGHETIECLMIHRAAASPIIPSLESPGRLSQVLSRFEPHVATVNLGVTEKRPEVARLPTAGTEHGYKAADRPEHLPPPPKSTLARPVKMVLRGIKRLALDE